MARWFLAVITGASLTGILGYGGAAGRSSWAANLLFLLFLVFLHGLAALRIVLKHKARISGCGMPDTDP